MHHYLKIPTDLHKKFGDSEIFVTFASAFAFQMVWMSYAEIAQLVERNLAKVEVAGPSPVFRSKTGGSRNQSFFLLSVSELQNHLDLSC